MKRLLIFFLLLLGVGGPLVGLAGPWHWFFDLANHFYYQWMCLSILCFVFLLLLRAFKTAGIVFLMSLWCFFSLFTFLPFEFEASAEPEQVKTVSILHANLYTQNKQHESLIEIVEQESPDILVFLEVGKAWEKALNEGLTEYQLIHGVIREDHFGISVYSKLPARLIGVEYLGKAKVPTLHLQVFIDQREVALWATHPYPPVSERNWKLRNDHIQVLHERLKDSLRPTVIVGDFNTAPWTVTYKDFVGDKFFHASHGKGIYGSWPANWPSWLRIPIDHIFHTRHFQSLEFKVLEEFGSDHVPILSKLQFAY